MNHWPSFPSSSSWQRTFSLCLARKHLGSHLTDNGCYIMTPCFHAHRHIDKRGCQARQYKVTNGRLGSHFWPYSESLISTWWYTYNMWIVTTCCETSGRHVADMSVGNERRYHRLVCKIFFFLMFLSWAPVRKSHRRTLPLLQTEGSGSTFVRGHRKCKHTSQWRRGGHSNSCHT